MRSVSRELFRPFRRLARTRSVQDLKHLHYRFALRHRSLPSPRFFIVGAPHAGSTSLYAYVRQHPQIWMSRPKEPNFFRSQRQGIGWVGAYLDLFAGAGPEHRVIGEASPWYLYDRNAAVRILTSTPDARIAMILRNPISRAVSQFQYRLRRSGSWPGDPVSLFREHVRTEAHRLHSVAGGRGHELRAGLYDVQVRRYLARFPPGRVHIMLTEELDSDPVPVLRKLFRFLDVEETFAPDTSRRHNPTAPEERIDLPGDLLMELRAYFAPDIAALAETLGRDLSGWLRP
jgi:Sulfotransferase domain